jgi:polyisoprenyl-phosphate glycosyltransferase
MGFRQGTVDDDKAARRHGRSGWTLRRKLDLVASSVTGFSTAPIRSMAYLGLAVAVLGLARRRKSAWLITSAAAAD